MGQRRGLSSGVESFGWGELPILGSGCSLEELVDAEIDVVEEAIVSIEAARLRRELRRLPELERRILVWHYGIGDAEQLTHSEIAERLGMPKGSIWKLEQHALQLMRGCYGLGEVA